jgi:subtilisin
MMQPTLIESTRLKSSRGRAVKGAVILLAAALVAVGLVLMGTSVPAHASPTFTTNATSDVANANAPSETSGTNEQEGTPDSSHLLQKAEREGSVRVIVRLRTDFAPEGRLGRVEAAVQRDGIESARAGLQEQLRGTGYQTLREYETVPYVALKLTPRALRAVQDSPHATTIQEDVAVPADLAQSAPKVQAPTMWANNFTGAGKTIAVLDTGVDRFHPFLGGRVVEEACYSSTSNCPNGQKTQAGTNSAAPCTYAANGCRHGTHVAGIAAGQGSNFSGVAPNANIMAVQVFSRITGTDCNSAFEDPCARTYTSDQIAGLERVYQLRNTRSFAAVNMSIGGGRYFDYCDTDSRKPIIDNLRSAGIATVIAAGNDSHTDSVSAPGCISTAVTVGSTTKQDTLSSFSNMSNMVDLLAPGESITSSVPGGGFAIFDGTSMAAPHVAGAWALLEEQNPARSWYDILFSLYLHGTDVTDTRPGGIVTGKRINIADAAGIAPQPANDNFANARIFSGYSYAASGTNVGATHESGDPAFVGPNNTSHTVWYRWTAPVAETVEIDTCYGLTNFDTILGVYTGSALGSLTEVTSNDDGCDFGRGSKVTLNATQGTTYHILVDGYATQKGDFTLEVVDKTAPTVASTTPANGGRVNPGANIKVTFSEPVMGGGVNPTTFKLKRSGTTTFIGATVSYDPATMRATLNPNNNLQSGRTYVATVTSGVRDEATNFLDQDASVAGNQPKTWKFTVN